MQRLYLGPCWYGTVRGRRGCDGRLDVEHRLVGLMGSLQDVGDGGFG